LYYVALLSIEASSLYCFKACQIFFGKGGSTTLNTQEPLTPEATNPF